MSLETMTKLQTVTVGAGGSSSVTFSNIPQNYTDLRIVASARKANNDYDIDLKFNGSSTGYSGRYLEGNGASVSSGSYSSLTQAWSGNASTNNQTAGVFGNSEIYIPRYSGNTLKSFSVDAVNENNATTAYADLLAWLWNNSSPITSIEINANGSTFSEYSTFTLYGIKNARQTAGNSIKATGGNIVFDGTYVYHVFNSTGAFTPTQSIFADVLVVAGGGGVSTVPNGYSGGGGAGGVIYFANQSLSTTSYTCTVGSGGAAASAGNNGNNSNFGALTAAVGGGLGGGWTGGAAGSGGSGGGSRSGAGGASTQTGTGATSYYGNAGGSGNGYIAGGGGGGAGAAGAPATADYVGGAGGNGTSAFSSWGFATGQGQNVSGTYYFAGGGSGVTSSTGGYGGGGGASSPYNGTANTGGGGSGQGGPGGTGSGGSGIIIVRYKG